MYADKDSHGEISLIGLTSEQAEDLQIALTRILPELSAQKETEFRRLLIQIDKLLPVRDNDTTEND